MRDNLQAYGILCKVTRDLATAFALTGRHEILNIRDQLMQELAQIGIEAEGEQNGNTQSTSAARTKN